VSIKSQLVDDVLDILIRNGELPPSAAHDPLTPTTARDPPPLPPPLPAHLPSKLHSQPHTPDIKFPYIDMNELGLDLESLGEAMELGNYENIHPPTSTSTSAVVVARDDVTESMEMDVADWLDTLLPSASSSTSSSTSGFSSGSDQNYLLHHHQPSSFHPQYHQQQVQHGHHQLSGDPLFSSLSSGDPYTDLFSLEDSDLKLPAGLGNSLSWDRLDFTA